jgi:hypothetical protein
MSHDITEQALKVYGELAVLRKTKILNYSALLWKNDTLYQMNQTDR